MARVFMPGCPQQGGFPGQTELESSAFFQYDTWRTQGAFCGLHKENGMHFGLTLPSLPGLGWIIR
jgi:hypothetical protein